MGSDLGLLRRFVDVLRLYLLDGLFWLSRWDGSVSVINIYLFNKKLGLAFMILLILVKVHDHYIFFDIDDGLFWIEDYFGYELGLLSDYEIIID